MSRSSVSTIPSSFMESNPQEIKVFTQNVSTFTSNLFDNSQFSDFEIVFTKLQKTLKVWKGILSVNSEFFQALFSSTNNFSENLCGQLILEDFYEENSLYKIVKSFYTGKLEYSLDDEGLSLLIFSQKYMVQGQLSKHLKDEIQMNISPQNCFKFFKQLIVYNGSFNSDDGNGQQHVIDAHFLHSIMKSVVLEMARNFSNILKENISELLDLSPESLLFMMREFEKLSKTNSSTTPLIVASQTHRKSTTSLYGSLTSSYSNPYSPSSNSSSFTKRKYERFSSSPSIKKETNSSNSVYIRCDGKLFLRFIMDWMIVDVETRKDYLAEIKSIEGTFNYSNY